LFSVALLNFDVFLLSLELKKSGNYRGLLVIKAFSYNNNNKNNNIEKNNNNNK